VTIVGARAPASRSDTGRVLQTRPINPDELPRP